LRAGLPKDWPGARRTVIRSLVHLPTILLLALLVACGPSAPRPVEQPPASPTPEPPLALGLILSLSNDAGPDGTQRHEAAKLAVDLVNRRGGVALPTGGRRTLSLVTYDDAGRPALAETAIRRLSEDGVLAVIGPSRPETSAVARRVAETVQVPLVTLDDEGNLGNEGSAGRWSFSVAATPDEAVGAALDFFVASGVERLAWLAPRTMEASTLRRALGRMAASASIPIVAEEQYAPGEDDLSQNLARLQASNPSVILAWPRDYREAASIARDASRARDLAPVFLGPSASHPNTLTQSGDTIAGVRTLTLRLGVADDLWDHDPLTPVIRDFRRELQARIGKPPTPEAAEAWDAVRLVVATLERTGPTRMALRDGLESTAEYPGASGSISFNARRHTGLDRKAYVVARADARRWRLPP
jgi:branched-chain amino acid transport system substrate-binding protein